MSSGWYYAIAVAVGAALWMRGRDLGIAKILALAVFWPVLIILLPLLVYRGGSGQLLEILKLPARARGVKPIPPGETYTQSDPAGRCPEELPNAPDIDIVIPTFGPIADQSPEESPAPPPAQ